MIISLIPKINRIWGKNESLYLKCNRDGFLWPGFYEKCRFKQVNEKDLPLQIKSVLIKDSDREIFIFLEKVVGKKQIPPKPFVQFDTYFSRPSNALTKANEMAHN